MIKNNIDEVNGVRFCIVFEIVYLQIYFIYLLNVIYYLIFIAFKFNVTMSYVKVSTVIKNINVLYRRIP